MSSGAPADPVAPGRAGAAQVFGIFLRLGLTSFGGPVAHLGYFREEFVTRRRWLGERAYADLVALCQFLPGPASSQVGMALGLMRAGYAGAFAAWAGFTLPSALALIALALGLVQAGDTLPPGLLHGLKLAAVAVVAQAVWGMARALCQGAARATLMVAAAAAVLALPAAGTQLAVIAAAGLWGLWWLQPVAGAGAGAGAGATAAADPDAQAFPVPLGPRAGLMWLVLFFALLAALPLATAALAWPGLAQADAFYRAGALVFGGGHVVLPLLQTEVVASGWVREDLFLAGYGATQAVPGPLFTFAAFLGAATGGPAAGAGLLGGWAGGLLCLVAVFVPAFLLVAGALPFWAALRRQPRAQGALAGVNAAVVGLLLAALYQPVWTGAVHASQDFALVAAALLALTVWRAPPWAVVLGCGSLGALLG